MGTWRATAIIGGLSLVLLAGCSGGIPVRNLANQDGNAGPPAGRDAPIYTGSAVWKNPLPPPGPIRVGRRA